MTLFSVLVRWGGIFDFDNKKELLQEVERELEQPDVWDNPEHAQQLGKQRSSLEMIVVTLEDLSNDLKDLPELLDLSEQENDEEQKNYEKQIKLFIYQSVKFS